MSQEATMIAIDTSNYMRNGDLLPNRFGAQKEALSLICSTKKRLNPENTVGLITLSCCQVICTLTTDTMKVYSQASQIVPNGEISFCTAVAIAHLALRNRQSRNQKPKIFIFIGSPVEDNEEELLKIAKRLKKEKVTVTIISFGEAEYNEKKLTMFIDMINGKESNTSQVLTIPNGSGIQEYLRFHPEILGALEGTERNTGLDYGLDGMEDPDLAYALRISLEEQRMIQAQQAAPKAPPLLNNPAGSVDENRLNETVTDVTVNRPRDVLPDNNLQAMTEEEQISYAINMSLLATEQNVSLKKEIPPKDLKKKKSSREHSDSKGNKDDNNGSKKKRKK